MKLKLVTMVAMAATLAFTSCNNEDSNAVELSKYITVEAGMGSLSRATATAFETGDAISVYAWTGSNAEVQTPLVVNNAVNTYDGTKWTASPQMLWADVTTPHYFFGVYPSKTITDFTADSYDTVADVLVATVLGEGRTSAGGIVPMIFDHIMSRIVVNLTFRTQWDGAPTVTSLAVNVQPGATVNYLTKTVTATGTASDFALGVTTANTSYEGIVIPQTASIIKIVIDGKTYTYTHPTGFTLESGKIQTVNLIVGRDEITLGSITINEWTAGDTIDGGEAQTD